MYQVSSPCIVLCASLRSEEVVIARGNFLSIVVMKMLKFTCTTVSAPCIAWFASLRSEEVVIGKSARQHFC